MPRARLDRRLRINFRDGDLELVGTELLALAQRAHGYGELVKVIVEICYLDEAQRLASLVRRPECGVYQDPDRFQ